MNSREGYDAYCLYLAISNHFHTDSYNFFQYNGKVSASINSYLKRNDKYHFAKLARQYNNVNELRDFYIANLSKEKIYSRRLLEQECEENYKSFKKRKQKLTYLINEEMKMLFDKYKDLDVVLGIKNGQHSNLLREYLGGNVSQETMIACDKIFNIFNDYDNMISEKIIWPMKGKILRKLEPFIELEHTKIRTLLLGLWKEPTS